jgi:zinc protease
MFTRDPYLTQFQASLVKAEDLQTVKEEFIKAFEKAKKTPYSEAEIAEAKSRLRYSFAMGMDSPTAIAENLSFFTWVSGDPESINRTYALYEKVTAQDMMNAAKKYLVPAGLTIATISPAEKCPVK